MTNQVVRSVHEVGRYTGLLIKYNIPVCKYDIWQPFGPVSADNPAYTVPCFWNFSIVIHSP